MSLLPTSLAAACGTLALAGSLAAQSRPAGPPPIPPVSGPLQLRVVYPLQGQRLTVTDSTFLFGSTGDGRAALTINGAVVPVAPNGAFLAFVAIPRDSVAVFRLEARNGADSAIHELRVLLPRAPSRAGVWLDPASIAPSGIVWAEPGELLRFSVVASSGARVFLERRGFHPIEFQPDTARSASYGPFDRQVGRPAPLETRYVAALPADALTDVFVDTPGQAEFDALPCCGTDELMISVQRDSLGMAVRMPMRLKLVHPSRRPVVMLDDDTARTGNTDGTVTGMPVPSGTYNWFFENGTPAAVSGRAGSFLRLRLSRTSSAWVSTSDVAATLPPMPEPRARLRLVRLFDSTGFVTARIALNARIPFRVDEDGRRLVVRFYGAQADADWLQYGSSDPWVERMSWEQTLDDEVALTFELPRPVYGWRARWDGTDLLLDIRRPPRIRNAARPLAGRVIAVDPGHPPAGATGPTGLREAEANLSVARELRTMLERAGATVVMMRDADTNVGLYERTNLAERVDADVLVSIHNNAFPDGVNPFENNGTSTYYYHPRSARLARLVQQGMVRTMGLRDLGFGRGDLALVRITWMPSVLTEGAFMMVPEQENGLRTPAFQRAYARGVMDGLTAYFRELAR